MKEWTIYSSKTGAVITGLGFSSEEMTEEEAWDMAEEMYGDDIYIAERTAF